MYGSILYANLFNNNNRINRYIENNIIRYYNRSNLLSKKIKLKRKLKSVNNKRY